MKRQPWRPVACTSADKRTLVDEVCDEMPDQVAAIRRARTGPDDDCGLSDHGSASDRTPRSPLAPDALGGEGGQVASSRTGRVPRNPTQLTMPPSTSSPAQMSCAERYPGVKVAAAW